MRKFIFIAIMALSCSSFAWTETTPVQKEYSFKFVLNGQIFKTSEVAPSYEDAYKVVAQRCFNHYKGSGHVSEDRGLDIIDVCANPHS